MTKTVTLGEICEVNPGRAPRIDDKTPVTFLAMADVSEDGKITNAQTRPYEEVKKGFTAFQEEDVLVAKITPCFENGKGAMATKLTNGIGFGSTEFHVLRPKSGVSSDYIFYATRTPSFKENGKKSMTGSAGQQRITTAFVSNHKLPLPSLPEQRRIAALLDRADALRQKDRQLLAHYDQLAQSLFLDMFGDPVKNEKGWEKVPFGEIGDSRLGKMLDAKQQTGQNCFPYLGNSNVQWGRFKLNDLLKMDFSEKDRREFELRDGDLLICEGGEVGRTAIWRGQIKNCYFQKALHRVRLDSKTAIPEYIQALMWNLAKNNGFKDFTTIATIAHLTGIKLKSMPVIVPPLPLQTQFAQLIEQIEKQKDVVRRQMAASEALFGRLLQQCFG